MMRHRAVRVLGALPHGSSRPLLVSTTGGTFVIKLVGGPEGPRALAAEVITTSIARAIGLPTLEVAIVDLHRKLAREIVESELREAVVRGSGMCLGIRQLAGAAPARADQLAAASDEFVSKVLWLDVLTENPDRRAANPNILALGNALIPIDHASSLPFHHDWNVEEVLPSLRVEVPRDHVFAARASLFDRAKAELRVKRVELTALLEDVPGEWLGPIVFRTEARQRAAYVAYLWKRLRAIGEAAGVRTTRAERD